MEKRRFGRTGHDSSVAIFGAAAFYEITQEKADEVLEYILTTEINHIDIAAGYRDAEDRSGSFLAKHRSKYFLGGKTEKRTKKAAAKGLRESLKKLRVSEFDLFQMHGIVSIEELNQVMSKGGALEAILDAQREGLTRFIGITSHGWDTPVVLLEALKRFDFDSVLFPINPNFYGNPEYKRNAKELLKVCNEKDVGMMIIKSIAKGAWGDKEKTYTTWYEPFDTPEEIQQGIDFALSQNVTGICTAADITLLSMVVEACEQYSVLSQNEQIKMIERAKTLDPIFEVEKNK